MIRRRSKAKGEHRGSEPRNINSKPRRAVVEQEDEHKRRDTAEDPLIDESYCSKELATIDLHQGNKSAKDVAHRNQPNQQFYIDERCAEQPWNEGSETCDYLNEFLRGEKLDWEP